MNVETCNGDERRAMAATATTVAAQEVRKKRTDARVTKRELYLLVSIVSGRERAFGPSGV